MSVPLAALRRGLRDGAGVIRNLGPRLFALANVHAQTESATPCFGRGRVSRELTAPQRRLNPRRPAGRYIMLKQVYRDWLLGPRPLRGLGDTRAYGLELRRALR
ncbi:hypothetical protein MRX96_019185 [Rhipicephalus microplus]